MSGPMPSNSRNIFLETFGCQMNVLDSELVASQLSALGMHFVDDWKQADVVLYNTCSVREHAEQKVYSRVGRVGKHKAHNPHVVLGVIGCMAEREGRDVARRYPQIDLLCGPGELDKLPMLIDNALKTSPHRRASLSTKQVALQGNTHRRTGTLAATEDHLEMLDLSRSFSPDEHHGSAYVRITRGCNKFCTFCVVPNTRGPEVHRPPDHIVDECKRLVDAGVVEVTLIGQTVNHYHYHHGAAVTVGGVQQPQVGQVIRAPQPLADSHTTPQDATSFAQLLARIHDDVPDLPRLRFVTSYPRDFGDDILAVMRDRPRICRYLHLPVQSGSNRILKLMNRGYTVEKYFDLLGRVREALPDAQIASDLICGFPAETDDDHAATIDLLHRALFKNCFIFKYSPRPGTAAYTRFEDDVPEETKRQRNNELLTVQSEMSDRVHRAMVGRQVRVLVESISHREHKHRSAAATGFATGVPEANVELRWEPARTVTQLTGRTDGDLIVMFDGDESLVGSIVNVKVESAKPLSLFGQIAQTPTPV